MKNRIIVITFMLLLVVGVYSGFTEGDFPNGCVSCHAVNGGNDSRMNVGIKENMPSHVPIDSMITNVPGDCAMCHSGDDLGKVVHKVHYSNPFENHFVEDYGDCLSCHALDAGTGVMTVKSGKKNW